MEKLTITPGEKAIFSIDIALSEAQLKFLCEIAGDYDYNYLANYYVMTKENGYQSVTMDPSFDSGLGADINDALSLGFMLLNHLDYGQRTKFKPEDLNYHPFSLKRPVIKSIETEMVDVEIISQYEPIQFALSGETGEIVHIEDFVNEKSDEEPYYTNAAYQVAMANFKQLLEELIEPGSDIEFINYNNHLGVWEVKFKSSDDMEFEDFHELYEWLTNEGNE